MSRKLHILFCVLFMGGFLAAQGQPETRLAELAAKVKVAEKDFRPKDTVWANSLVRLADAQWEAGLNADAEANLRLAADVIGTKEKPNPLRLAECLAHLGKFYWVNHRPRQAQACADSASLLLLDPSLSGPAQIIELQLLKATIAFQAGDFEAAEALYQDAAQLQERRFGSQSAQLAETLNNLGAVFAAKRNFPRALGIYRHVFNMQEAVYGLENAASTTTLINIGTTLSEMGEFAEAEQTLRRAYQLRNAQLPPADPLTLSAIDNIVYFLVGLGRNAEAEAFLREVQASLAAKVGVQGLEMAACHDRWTAFHFVQGNLDKAEEHTAMALEIRRQSPLKLDREIGSNELNLGRLHNLQGRHAQAVIDLKGAMDHFSQDLYGYEDILTDILGELFSAHFSQGQIEEAEDCLNTLLDIKVELYGGKSLEVQELLEIMEDFFRETEQYEPLLEVQFMLKAIDESRVPKD